MQLHEIERMCNDILTKNGLNSEESRIVTNEILEAEMRGKSAHGLAHLPRIVAFLRENKRGKIVVKKEGDCFALVEGNGNLGSIVASFAMKLAITKAKRHGISFVGGCTHDMFILAGNPARIALEEEMIAVVMCNSRARMAPWGGIDPVVGVNPICVAIPAKPPIVLDMATSRITVSDINLAKRLGKQIPTGCALDKDGNETQSPEEALLGTILPFDTYKGFGLAFVIELLAGPLVGAKGGKTVTGSRGFLFIVINPKLIGDLEDFERKVSDIALEVKRSRKKNDISDVFFPGEKSEQNKKVARLSGIEIGDAIFDDIKKLL